MVVYKVTSPSRKVYIGITVRALAVRRWYHEYSAKCGSPHLIHKAIRKYGEQLKWEVLEQVSTRQEAELSEKRFIEQFDSFNRGYNMTLGGDGWTGGSVEEHMSEDAVLRRRERISKGNLGKKYSPERKLKIAESVRKSWLSRAKH